jgi:hypothetical protein
VAYRDPEMQRQKSRELMRRLREQRRQGIITQTQEEGKSPRRGRKPKQASKQTSALVAPAPGERVPSRKESREEKMTLERTRTGIRYPTPVPSPSEYFQSGRIVGWIEALNSFNRSDLINWRKMRQMAQEKTVVLALVKHKLIELGYLDVLDRF